MRIHRVGKTYHLIIVKYIYWGFLSSRKRKNVQCSVKRSSINPLRGVMFPHMTRGLMSSSSGINIFGRSRVDDVFRGVIWSILDLTKVCCTRSSGCLMSTFSWWHLGSSLSYDRLGFRLRVVRCHWVWTYGNSTTAAGISGGWWGTLSTSATSAW